MTAMVDNAVADLRRANAELQRQLDEALAEREEALDQQTATAEVLRVINSSPGDLAPVFEAMLEKALGLCGAAFGHLWTYDGECFQAGTSRGGSEDYAALFDELKIFLTGNKQAESYGEMAIRLKTTEAALKMAVSRMRQRYGELLRAEIAQTVGADCDIDAELQYFIQVLSTASSMATQISCNNAPENVL